MKTIQDPIVARNLDTVDANARPDALRGWDWLATEAEKLTGQRPAPEGERVAYWLGRLQDEGMQAFGLHGEIALAFFASIGHADAVSAILDVAVDESEPLNRRWVGQGAEQLANDALRLAAHGCTDQRAVALLMQLQSRGMSPTLAGPGGQTPLHAACAAGRPGLVSALLACGADPGAADELGKTALHWVASKPVWRDRLSTMESRARIVADLIAAGANLEQVDGSGVSARQALSSAGWAGEALEGVAALCARHPRTHAPPSMRRH